MPDPIRSLHPYTPMLRATAVLLVAANACGGGSNTDQARPTKSAPEEFGLTLADLAARVESTEGLIAGCMTDAGFQYVAVDFSSVKAAMDSDQTAAGVSSDEFVKQFGLGVTTQFDKPIITFGAGPENSAFLESLAATDQVAYRRALWGEAPDWNHARALEAEDFSQTGGCTRSAAEQTYSPAELTGSYVNPADTLIEQDPRMIAAIERWADCVRADGYEYDHPDQVADDLTERLTALAGGQDPTSLTGPALDALRDLQGEELAVAAVLTGCEEEHIEPVQAKVETEIYGALPS